MRERIALFVVMGALAGWGLAATIGGCGSDADGVGPDGAASSSSGTPTGSGSGEAGLDGASSSSSSSGSSGTPGDGGSDSSLPVTLTPNPGKITCGASECDAGGFNPGAANRCCIRDGGAVAACSTGFACDNDDLELSCDEPGDCNQFAPKCCLHPGSDAGGGFLGRRSSCEIGCGFNGAGVALCKTNADCSDGGANQPACNVKKCGAYNVPVCGSPAECQ